jgi:NitT/TauT family transport system substrate-binding protein
VARGYAMGSIFSMANPEAAVRIYWELYPQSKSLSKDEATALKDDVHVLSTRIKSWPPAGGGATKWGESVVANYQAYLDWLLKAGVLKEKAVASELVTNELIDDINKFDIAAIEKLAKDWKP